MNDHKSIFDPRFKYVPSHQTNVEETFKRIRKEQAKNEADSSIQKVRAINTFRNKTK